MLVLYLLWPLVYANHYCFTLEPNLVESLRSGLQHPPQHNCSTAFEFRWLTIAFRTLVELNTDEFREYHSGSQKYYIPKPMLDQKTISLIGKLLVHSFNVGYPVGLFPCSFYALVYGKRLEDDKLQVFQNNLIKAASHVKSEFDKAFGLRPPLSDIKATFCKSFFTVATVQSQIAAVDYNSNLQGYIPTLFDDDIGMYNLLCFLLFGSFYEYEVSVSFEISFPVINSYNQFKCALLTPYFEILQDMVPSSVYRSIAPLRVPFLKIMQDGKTGLLSRFSNILKNCNAGSNNCRLYLGNLIGDLKRPFCPYFKDDFSVYSSFVLELLKDYLSPVVVTERLRFVSKACSDYELSNLMHYIGTDNPANYNNVTLQILNHKLQTLDIFTPEDPFTLAFPLEARRTIDYIQYISTLDEFVTRRKLEVYYDSVLLHGLSAFDRISFTIVDHTTDNLIHISQNLMYLMQNHNEAVYSGLGKLLALFVINDATFSSRGKFVPEVYYCLLYKCRNYPGLHQGFASFLENHLPDGMLQRLSITDLELLIHGYPVCYEYQYNGSQKFQEILKTLISVHSRRKFSNKCFTATVYEHTLFPGNKLHVFRNEQRIAIYLAGRTKKEIEKTLRWQIMEPAQYRVTKLIDSDRGFNLIQNGYTMDVLSVSNPVNRPRLWWLEYVFKQCWLDQASLDSILQDPPNCSAIHNTKRASLLLTTAEIRSRIGRLIGTALSNGEIDPALFTLKFLNLVLGTPAFKSSNEFGMISAVNMEEDLLRGGNLTGYPKQPLKKTQSTSMLYSDIFQRSYQSGELSSHQIVQGANIMLDDYYRKRFDPFKLYELRQRRFENFAKFVNYNFYRGALNQSHLESYLKRINVYSLRCALSVFNNTNIQGIMKVVLSKKGCKLFVNPDISPETTNVILRTIHYDYEDAEKLPFTVRKYLLISLIDSLKVSEFSFPEGSNWLSLSFESTNLHKLEDGDNCWKEYRSQPYRFPSSAAECSSFLQSFVSQVVLSLKKPNKSMLLPMHFFDQILGRPVTVESLKEVDSQFPLHLRDASRFETSSYDIRSGRVLALWNRTIEDFFQSMATRYIELEDMKAPLIMEFNSIISIKLLGIFTSHELKEMVIKRGVTSPSIIKRLKKNFECISTLRAMCDQAFEWVVHNYFDRAYRFVNDNHFRSKVFPYDHPILYSTSLDDFRVDRLVKIIDNGSSFIHIANHVLTVISGNMLGVTDVFTLEAMSFYLGMKAKSSTSSSYMFEFERDADLLINTCHAIGAFNFLPSYSIRYTKNDGIDSGGLKRDWLGLLSHGFRALYNVDSEGYLNITREYSDATIECFARYLAFTLAEGYSPTIKLPLALIRYMFTAKIDPEDVKWVEPEMYQQFSTLRKLQADELIELELNFEIIDTNRKIVKLKEIDEAVTPENLEEYIAAYSTHLLVKDQLDVYKRIRNVFKQLVPGDYFVNFNDYKALQEFYRGDVNVDEVTIKCLPEGNFTGNCNWINSYYEDLQYSEKLDFLFAVTGATSVSKQYPIIISHDDFLPNNTLPVAHTCFYRLDVPIYESKEALYLKMDQFLTYVTRDSSFQAH